MGKETKEDNAIVVENIIQKLKNVQSELKAPKGQFNKFGGYKYRSAEDILESVKPLLYKHGLALTIVDDIVMIADRIYVKATARLHDCDSDKILETTAFAREELAKKGMDGSQVTGASSSYARKYALNGLFCIDDTKDSDATNDHGKGGGEEPPKEPQKAKAPPPWKKAWDLFTALDANKGATPDGLKTAFNNMCLAVTQGKSPKTYTAEDWSKVEAAIKEIDE